LGLAFPRTGKVSITQQRLDLNRCKDLLYTGPKAKQKGVSPVTIIVGILCTDGIVIGSDSQATYNVGVDIKRLDCTKIESVTFVDTKEAILAGSGMMAYITRFSEIMTDEGKRCSIISNRAVANIAESTINKITKKYVIDRSEELGVPIDNPNSVGSLNFAIMLTHYFDGKPYLFNIYPEGLAEKQERYASLGSGSPFADYILSKLYYDSLSLKDGVRLAAYIIEEVKKVDPNVGGPTKIFTINKDNKTDIKDAFEIQAIINEFWRVDFTMKLIWDRMKTPLPDNLEFDDFKKALADMILKS